MMTRNHVRAMMGPQGLGYKAALRVLEVRKARGEFYTYLEELRKQQLAAERLAATTADEAVVDGGCGPGCGVCLILAGTSRLKKYRPLYSACGCPLVD